MNRLALPNRTGLFIVALCYLLGGTALSDAQVQEKPSSKTEDPAIDFTKARALLQKERAGQSLSEAERRYLERAQALRRQQEGSGREAAGALQRPAPERLIPLTDLTSEDRYEGEDGGLYGGGQNVPLEPLAKMAATELAKIQALDAAGMPAADGRIVFISISMSNATQEFSRFKELADRSPAKSERVAIVDCAQGGQAMAQWVPADARPWKVALQRLGAAGVTPQQVQVAWVKLANMSPSGSLQEHGKKLEADTVKVLHNARKMFPNLRIAYLGSRIWAGNAKGRLNPEPYAYESAFVVRWLIRRQLEGDPELALASTPLLLWGPYLWAEGARGRKTDALVWRAADFAGDGVHPSQSGRQKVAEQLLDFVTTNPLAKPWFAGP